MLVEFGQKAKTMSLYDSGRLVSIPMVFESMVHRQTGHAHINAGFCGVASGIATQQRAIFARLVAQEADQKAKRDARYAARKERGKKKR